MPKLTQSEKRAITREVVTDLDEFLAKQYDAKPGQLNKEIDKCDFSFTHKGQHFWLVLLREPLKTIKAV